MAKIIRCREVGVDCDFEARGATKQEVLARGIEVLPPELPLSRRRVPLAPPSVNGRRPDGKTLDIGTSLGSTWPAPSVSKDQHRSCPLRIDQANSRWTALTKLPV